MRPIDGTLGLSCTAKSCQLDAFGADGAACGALASGFASCASGGNCFIHAVEFR